MKYNFNIKKNLYVQIKTKIYENIKPGIFSDIKKEAGIWSLNSIVYILKWQEEFERPPLVLKNANIFYAHSGEFRKGDVAVADGLILGTGSYSGERETDLSGKYLCLALLTVTFTWNLLL
mgnify:CR=1 FL=1